MKNFKKAVKEIRENVSDNELKTIFEELDNNDNGYITIIEFFKIQMSIILINFYLIIIYFSKSFNITIKKRQ